MATRTKSRTSTLNKTKTPRARRSRQPKNAATLAQEILNSLPQPPAVKPVTHVKILLDKSGSMDPHRAGAVKALNEIIVPLQGKSREQDIRAEVVQFGADLTCTVPETAADNLKPITNYDYYPNEGHTALNYVIAKTIQDLKSLPDYKDPNVSFLLIVITDGRNNHPVSLPHYSDFQVRNWIQELQGTDRFTLVVSCPQGDVTHIGKTYGVPEGNIQGWDQNSKEGMETVSRGTQRGLTNYVAIRATGQRATKSFYEEINIGRQGIRAVTKDLVAERVDRFKRVKVTKQTNVKDLIESKGMVFELGRLFYQLQKPETVQHHKEIILQRRDDATKMYGGAQVRDKLGIPHGADGKVVPGNLGEWVVWIQSTSPNRKLLAGMEVLYDTNAVVSNTGHGSVVSR